MIKALVLAAGVASAALAGWITLDRRAEAELSDAVLTVRTHNFDGTVRGRLDPYFQAHPQQWRMVAERIDGAVQVRLEVGEQVFRFSTVEGDVTAVDEPTRAFVGRLRAWADTPAHP